MRFWVYILGVVDGLQSIGIIAEKDAPHAQLISV
jgi:hypothetical protein